MIVELCNVLQSLPLALQHAIAYIKIQKDNLSCVGSTFEISDYLKKYSTMTHELLDSEDSDSNYDKSVFATWNITFDTLKGKESGSDALNILNIMSYLLPENIPVELLLIFLTDKEKLSSAIGLLKQYSIVSVQHKAFSIHRLVQQVIRIKLQKQNEEVNILHRALKLLNENNVNHKNVDHLISMLTFVSKHRELIVEYSRIASSITVELGSSGRIEEAYSIGLEGLELLNTLPRSDVYAQVSILAFKNNIARIILVKGEYSTALKLFQELYELNLPILGPSNNLTLNIKSNIALALYKLGRIKEALKCKYELLYAERDHLGENHANTLITKYSIASILCEHGNHQEGLLMFQEIYSIQKITLGDRSKETLKTKSSIAAALLKLNRLNESLKLLKEVYIEQKASLPENHPDILNTKFNMAGALCMQEKFGPALKIYRELFDININKFGENHPDVVGLNVSIAGVLAMQGKHEEALNMFEDALHKQQNSLGFMHPKTIRIQIAIAAIFVKQEKFVDALNLYKDILDKEISVLGNNHQQSLQTRRYIVKTLVEMKKYDEALEHSIEALNNAESIFGKDHPSTLTDKNSVGMMYFYNNDCHKALAILMQVFDLQKRFLGEDHDDCQKTKNNIVAIFAERDKLKNQVNKTEKCNNFTNNELFNVVKDGNIAQLEQFLKNGIDVNTKDADGRTLLHHAVNVEAKDIVNFLLKNGADVSLTSNKCNTSLHIATSKNAKELVELLLESVTNRDQLKKLIDIKTKISGSTCLHIAAKKGYLDVLISLLKRYATFDIKDNEGRTAVILANDKNVKELLIYIQKGFAKCANISGSSEFYEKLRRYSVDEYCAVMNTRNSDGHRLLQVVIANKRMDLLNILLHQKKSKFRQVFPVPESDFKTVLEQIDNLIEQAENYRLITKPQYTSLQVSLNSKVSNLDPLFLLQNGIWILKHAQTLVSNYEANAHKLRFPINEPNIDTIIQALDFLEFNPLYESSTEQFKNTNCRFYQMLHSQSKLDIKMFVEIVETSIYASVFVLRTRLYSAKLFNAVKRVNYLEAKRYFNEDTIDVHLQDTDRRTMLHHASNAADERLVELLLEHGAEIFVTSNKGNTPLHIAVLKGRLKIVMLLLQKLPAERLNDFVNAKTISSASTALHVAAKNGNFDIVKYLLKNRAIFCVTNKDGKTPLDLSSDAKVISFFKMIHELFDSVKEIGATDVICKLNALPMEEFLAVTNTRNNQGSTLAQAAILNNQKSLAAQILQMLQKMKPK